MNQQISTNTIVIGAGPAGLAAGACLKRADVPFVMLEKADKVGSSWRGHYDRLHLHTNKGSSNLPYYRFPKDFPRYPSRLQVIEHLENYANHFGLSPRFGQQVHSAGKRNGRWETETQDTLYHSEHVVVSTGYMRVPNIPSWPGQEDFEGPLFHTTDYKNAEAFAGKRVLVIGFGNSGTEIALDLWEHDAKPSMAVRSPVNIIPRDLLGMPIVAIAISVKWLPTWLSDAFMAPVLRLLYGNTARLGLKKLPYGPLTQIDRTDRIPHMDFGLMNLIKKGDVKIYGDIERFDGNEAAFKDGQKKHFDAVILATGFYPRVGEFLETEDETFDAAGLPLTSGREALPGLFFCGFNIAPTGLLRRITGEAKQIAAVIGGRKSYAA